jgi:serine/threonine protein kinase
VQLLSALRDATKAHRSLYVTGGILHRDISENNIIITDPKNADGFWGMLIDLDLAKIVGAMPSGARHRTGTMEFMPIRVLRKLGHDYRDDGESILYVLLWMCARRAWEREFRCKLRNQPKESMLSNWYTGSYKRIAQSKEHAMSINGFDELLEEFPQAFDCVKPLCRKLRGILFPLLENGALSTAAPQDPEQLYGPIVKAFDEGISEIAKIEQSGG